MSGSSSNGKSYSNSKSNMKHGPQSTVPEPEPELEKALELTFDANTNEINLTLFEHVEKGAVPLNLKFQFLPQVGACPIQEIVEDRNHRIKQHYWKLWELDENNSSDMDTLKIDAIFEGDEVTVQDEEVARYSDMTYGNLVLLIMLLVSRLQFLQILQGDRQ